MAMERHAQSVSKIAGAVRAFFERREPYRIFHGSTNSTRPARSAQTKAVDISALNNVLSVDKARRIALVEPNVPMDKLVEATLPHGLVPPVIMEFPGITAGGGFAGTAGESSSFKHGFFDDTVERVEMVLADGEVVKAENPKYFGEDKAVKGDLFRGAAGAVGTLGVTTLLEVRLMEAKKYVKTRYRRTSSVAEAVAAIREETAKPENDYVDGILFSKDHGVIVTGTLTDEKPADVKPQTFSGAWDPWFYLHAKEKTASSSSASKTITASPAAAAASASSPDNTAANTTATSSATPTDYIPLAEYLFRYDRGGFWVGTAAFEYFSILMIPFRRFTRWFLDDFLHTRMMYRALHGSGESARFVVQDIAMPFETTERFVDYTASELGIWPLWLCPLQRRGPPTFHPFTTVPAPVDQKTPANKAVAADETRQDDLMLNVGVWGWGPADPAAFVQKNKELEDKVRELGGMKWLYAHTYYSPEQFWDMYRGKAWYDALREKYKAVFLPTVWDKVHVDAGKASQKKRHWLKSIRPLGGFYGIYKSIQSKDYFLHRNATWKWKGDKKE